VLLIQQYRISSRISLVYRCTKLEIQNSKSETNSKHKAQMTETLSRIGGSRLGFWISVIRACFGFRASDFGI